jgi:DNA-directed RNA polymerase specialized sigma24 family protein
MTPQLIEAGNNTIDVELDQLTYSAYLLTLDPDLALSVVMAAVDTSIEDHASHHDLLRRTIEMSLAQLRIDASAASDRESLAVEALLYSDSSFATSKLAHSLKELTNGNPILLLDSGARIAFVLHHVLGYSVNRASAMAQISEKQYHVQLRKAYVQLASLQLGAHAIAGYMLGRIALA